jgi:FAD/FMN-containing dehydrogenase
MNEQLRRALSPDLLARFATIVGQKYAVTAPLDQEPYLVEMRDLYHGRTPVVLRPGSVDEVVAILKLANETKTAIVPQGGNTGLVGGQIPHHGEVLLPQLLPSEGTCTIGGNLSTNAGGTAAIAHGIARSHALGLEVVLADGRVLRNLNKLKKDNTGYDLKNLFIGAEGTLGIITAAVLRLVPRPRSIETAFVGVPSPQAAVDLLGVATERTAGGVTSFEMMARSGIEAVVKHDASSRDPLARPYPWYVLIELASQARTGLREVLEEILSQGHDKGLVLDAAIADSLEQSKAFWRIREMFGEVQRHIGASIKHDVSVPVAAIPAFIEQANAAVTKLIPGTRLLPFGHVGDGNIHYNVTQPEGADKEKFLARWDEVNVVVFAVVKKFGGSISAEHGVGVLKRDILPNYKDPVALDLMRGMKKMLDPNGILNPGKVL